MTTEGATPLDADEVSGLIPAGITTVEALNAYESENILAAMVRDLVLDARAQLREGVVDVDEVAARFHHRLVSVHPFANGNGRHARLATDVLLEDLGRPRFTWGAANLDREGPARAAYLDALRQADGRVYAPLLAFVRS